MKKFKFTPLLIAALLSSGCSHSLTNDEIISETKKCTDAGMVAQQIYSGWTYETTRVQCVPKVEGK